MLDGSAVFDIYATSVSHATAADVYMGTLACVPRKGPRISKPVSPAVRDASDELRRRAGNPELGSPLGTPFSPAVNL
jgi:hypothetical protein